jgi:outer membrane protein, heavy metal efflux system
MRGARGICSFSVYLWAMAAAGAETLTLQQATDEALRNNPVIKQSLDRIRNAEGLKLQAGLKPNPRIVFQNENARAWEFSRPSEFGSGYEFFRDTDTYLYGGQTIERGGKRARRVDLASSTIERARGGYETVERQLRGRIASAYVAALTARKVRTLYRENIEAFRRIVDQQQHLTAEGSSPGADLLRFQVEFERLQAAEQNVELDATRSRITLLREMGRVDFRDDVELTEAMGPFDAVPLVPIDKVFTNRPEMQVANAAVREAEANSRLQRANAKPDPELQFGYKRTLGFDTLYTGVNMQLPLRNRNQGNIEAANADVGAAQAGLGQLKLQIAADVAMAQQEYETRLRQLKDHLQPLVDKSRESARIALGAYREGGFDLLRYLDAERARIEAEAAYVRGIGDVEQSALNLRLVQGELP